MSGFEDENLTSDSEVKEGFFKRLITKLKESFSGLGGKLRPKSRSGSPRRFEFKKLELKKVSENSNKIRWALIILTLFLLADITGRFIGMWIKAPAPSASKRTRNRPKDRFSGVADYDAILRRNMFNVEQKIPAPFDQGQLDCLSQAKPSSQNIKLLGTIVMSNEALSVALLEDGGNPNKIAVKKDEPFSDSKYVAKKVERRKFCFQVRASGDFEFIEIPDDSLNLGGSSAFVSSVTGIVPISEKSFNVDRNYLNASLSNLNDIVNTARAVPYTDPTTGKFSGFLLQSIDANSPFASLGMQRGDILTFVNDIILDNPGRGLEAFNRLRQSPRVTLGIIRNGQKTTLDYEVK